MAQNSFDLAIVGAGIYGLAQALQSADGSLVVGDSHHYAATPDPFAPESVDELILDEFRAVLDVGSPRVRERWTGTHASAPGRLALIDRPADAIRLVVITSGTGASTSFAIAEEVERLDEDTHGSERCRSASSRSPTVARRSTAPR